MATVTHNYGWAIILLTILINTALFPLRLTSMKSSRKMQQIQPLVNKINAAVVSAVATKDLRERYIALGAEPETSTPEAFAALIRSDIPAWAKVVKAAGAKAE